MGQQSSNGIALRPVEEIKLFNCQATHCFQRGLACEFQHLDQIANF